MDVSDSSRRCEGVRFFSFFEEIIFREDLTLGFCYLPLHQGGKAKSDPEKIVQAQKKLYSRSMHC